MSSPTGPATGPLRLLTVASRPSDLVEMADLTRALAERGHHVTLLYFFSSTDPTIPPTMARLIAMGTEPRIATAGVDVSVLPPPELRTLAEAAAAEVAAAMKARPAAKRRRIPMPRMPSFFGTLHAGVSWMRRHNLHRFYPKNTWLSRGVYSLAFNIDNFRNPREVLAMFRQTMEIRVRVLRLHGVGRREALELAYRGAAMTAQVQPLPPVLCPFDQTAVV